MKTVISIEVNNHQCSHNAITIFTIYYILIFEDNATEQGRGGGNSLYFLITVNFNM